MRQYGNSPIIRALVDYIRQYYNIDLAADQFYDKVWNIDTAGTYGLDVWGRIVVIDRYFTVPGQIEAFGHDTGVVDWAPFNVEPFAPVEQTTETYKLENDAYRVLILAKAMSNVFGRSCQEINRMLSLLFSGRGNAYALDLGSMRMRYVFEFYLEAFERAIVHDREIFARPAGVLVEIAEIPSNEFFGFSEANDGYLPFNEGVFYTGG